MTGEPVQVDAGDFRRALTLIVHAMRSDEAGMRDVIDDESVPSGRLVPLVRASVSILWQLAPKIRDTAAVAQMLDTLARVADTEERSARDRAVARLAVAQFLKCRRRQHIDVLHGGLPFSSDLSERCAALRGCGVAL